jgi:hypothetical protein
VAPIINGATRTDGGNAFRNNAANLINGNPVFDNSSDKFLVGNSMTGGFESRMTTTWGLPLWNSARTMYTAGTASSPTSAQFAAVYGDDGTPSARLHWGIENNGGEVMIRDHQVNYSEASPGTIENQTAQTPFVMGASYNGGDTTSTTTNLYSVWGNGKENSTPYTKCFHADQ